MSKSLVRSRCRLLFLLVTLSAIGCGSHIDLETAQKFQDAETAFSKAQSEVEFARVAGQYQQLLADDFVSGVVLYNQGNAWMRAGETGRAIAAWRQSQRYRPRDPYLQANLQSALTACRSQASVSPEVGVAGYVFFWQNWLSYPEKFVLTTVLLIAVCAAGVLGPLVVERRSARTLTLLIGAMFVVAAVSAVWDWQRYDQTLRGVVVEDQIEARKGNSESYAAAFTEPLREGSEFVVLEDRANWLNIRISGLGTAWIPSRAAVIY
ncbi:MAG: hypothetical protein ABGZ35_00340 [Planctomycetaceae bacterium]